ncbi:SAF domain-containing protein [Nocardioides sp. GCM10027113]|uniref:SAF domain-containing protein n=1 Tax=unclassified Nocardioides TaxID=2615069 RepID=UPI0036085090
MPDLADTSADGTARPLPLRDRVARRLGRVRRAVLARRRPLAALLAAVAVAAGLHATAAPPPPSETVLAAARDLPAGTTLEPGDLIEVALPPDAVPDGVADAPVGRTLAAPLRAGEALTDVRLVGPALTAADPGLTALPVRLPDPAAASLLEVGDRIDLLATDPQRPGAQVVAWDLPVLAVPPPADALSGGQPGAVVVVGADPAEVTAVTDAAVRLFLTFAYAR